MNPRPPPGSHINPNFAGHRQDTRPNVNYQPSERTPYSRGGGYGNRAPTNPRRDSNSHRLPQDDGLDRTQAGHKRKLDALRGPQQPREKKPGPQIAPSVPSFGAPIFPSTTTPAPSPPAANIQRDQTAARPKPASRTLGLTPKDGAEPEILSESEDEEIDEEAQFAELGTKLTFEHNGEVMTLNNEADLAAWRAERRKQFPTSHRVSQKESEMLQIGEERKRLLAGVARLHQAPRNRKSEVKTRSLHEQSKGKEDATGSLQSDTRIQELPEQKRHVGAPRIEEVESQPEPSAVVNDELVAEDDPMDAQNDSEVAKKEPGTHNGGGKTIGFNFFGDAKNLKSVFKKRILKSGSSIGYHLQKEDEIYYVISGNGTMQMNGKTFPVKPGDAILTRPGSSHGIKPNDDND
ncbi:MAG: cupin domain-containing protein, partial [Cytophagaceae bacterium]